MNAGVNARPPTIIPRKNVYLMILTMIFTIAATTPTVMMFPILSFFFNSFSYTRWITKQTIKDSRIVSQTTEAYPCNKSKIPSPIDAARAPRFVPKSKHPTTTSALNELCCEWHWDSKDANSQKN